MRFPVLNFPVLLATGLLAASTAFAQAPKPDDKGGGRKPPRVDCSQAKDPKACEAEVAKRREAVTKARQTCDGKPDGERRDCMRRELCASAKDPKQCEARAKEGAQRREAARKACEGKPEAERRGCMREHLGKK